MLIYNKKGNYSTKIYIYKRIYAFKNEIKLIKKRRKRTIAVPPIQEFCIFFLFFLYGSKSKMYLKLYRR